MGVKVNMKFWNSWVPWFCAFFWVKEIVNYFQRSPQAVMRKAQMGFSHNSDLTEYTLSLEYYQMCVNKQRKQYAEITKTWCAWVNAVASWCFPSLLDTQTTIAEVSTANVGKRVHQIKKDQALTCKLFQTWRKATLGQKVSRYCLLRNFSLSPLFACFLEFISQCAIKSNQGF